MPRKPRPLRSRRPDVIDGITLAWLCDEIDIDDLVDDGIDRFELFLLDGDEHRLRALWESAREEVLSHFVSAHPGHRPRCWWRFDAPEPRQRIGGSGVASSEKYRAIVPHLERGIPVYHEDVALGDPPSYESSAHYLKRRGLLFPGEAKLLRSKDFAPETVA